MVNVNRAQPSARSRWFRVLGTAATILASLAILAWLVYRQREYLIGFEWRFRPLPALAAFLLYSLDIFLVAGIWIWLLNTFGPRIDFRSHLRNYVMSHAAKRIPGTIWYVASRAYLYKQAGLQMRVTSFASGLELLIMVVSGIVVSLLFAIPVIRQYSGGLPGLIGILVLGALLLNPRTVSYLLRRIGARDRFALSYRKLLSWLAAYLAVWTLGGLVLYFVANIVIPLPIEHIPAVIGSWSLAGVISASTFFLPSNLGITEVSLSILLSQFMPSSISVVIAVLARLLLMVYDFFWLIVFIWVRPERSEGETLADS